MCLVFGGPYPASTAIRPSGVFKGNASTSNDRPAPVSIEALQPSDVAFQSRNL